MLQIISQLIHAGQIYAVTWRLLKNRDSYHDNIERYCNTIAIRLAFTGDGDEQLASLRILKYSLSQVHGCIILLDGKDTRDPDGNLVEYKSRIPELSKFRYEFLVADEAQNAKRLDGAYNAMFRFIQWNELLWVTRTLLSGSSQDLASPLTLIWNGSQRTLLVTSSQLKRHTHSL
jgi:hypothetical protein